MKKANSMKTLLKKMVNIGKKYLEKLSKKENHK